MDKIGEDAPERAQRMVAVPRLLVPVLLIHTLLAFIPRFASSFVIWDMYTPTGDLAFRTMNMTKPLVWPVTGAMLAGVVLATLFAMLHHRDLRSTIAPADAAVGLLLLGAAMYALGMHLAKPQMPQIRIAANPLIYSPAIVAYFLVWRNNLAGCSSRRWERIAVALIGLPSAAAFILAVLGCVVWVTRVAI